MEDVVVEDHTARRRDLRDGAVRAERRGVGGRRPDDVLLCGRAGTRVRTVPGESSRFWGSVGSPA